MNQSSSCPDITLVWYGKALRRPKFLLHTFNFVVEVLFDFTPHQGSKLLQAMHLNRALLEYDI